MMICKTVPACTGHFRSFTLRAAFIKISNVYLYVNKSALVRGEDSKVNNL